MLARPTKLSLAVAFGCLASSVGHAQTVSVLPKCGAFTTRFIVTTAGFSSCPECPPVDETVTIRVNGQVVHGPSGTEVILPVALDTLCAPMGVGCQSVFETVGAHEIMVQKSMGCDGQSGPCGYVESAVDTVTVTGSVQDPWIFFDFPSERHGQLPVFAFYTASPCGVPPCDTLHLIQALRWTAFDSAGGSRPVTESEQAAFRIPGFPNLAAFYDSLDAWTTPAGYHIDVSTGPRAFPYYTIPQHSLSKPGRTGSTPDTARMADILRRPDPAFPDGVHRLRADLEINAFCIAGEGRGHFLGRTTWSWERTKGQGPVYGAKVSGPTGSTGQPSPEFLEALLRYSQRTAFTLPGPDPP